MPLPIALDYRPALLSRAGIGRATRELARALAADDALSVHLFGHSLARARVPTALPGRARLHRWPIPGRTLPLLQRVGLGADRLGGMADVFHWTDYVQPPTSRARTVLTVHDLAFVRDAAWHGDNAQTLRERTAAAIARADAVIVPSQATFDDVRAFAPDAAPPRVIAFGADHVPTGALPHPLGGREFALCLGTIEPRKNHRALLAAWRQLRQPRPLLVVVGDVGWECADVVAELERCARDGDVMWLRRANDELVWPLLQHARLLAYPSLWEGFGFPPLEAMAAGVPVMANDSAPLRELGDGALALCDARDVDALAQTLDEVLHDVRRRDALVAAGRARAAEFTWRGCAAAHREVYCEVAA